MNSPTEKVIIEQDYTSESLYDIGEDIEWAIEHAVLPVDEHGFAPGTFKLRLTWVNEETQ